MSITDNKNLEAVAFNRKCYENKEACISHLKCEYCCSDHYDSICCCIGIFTCKTCNMENDINNTKKWIEDFRESQVSLYV